MWISSIRHCIPRSPLKRLVPRCATLERQWVASRFASSGSSRKSNNNKDPNWSTLVASASAVTILAAYIAYSGILSPKQVGEEQREQHPPPPAKFLKIAKKTSELCQDFLSIVSDEEKPDSLQRIDHLLSMIETDRQKVYRHEWNAVANDEVAQSMTERNRTLLRKHLLHQQNLVQLLTCEQAPRSSKNMCEEVTGRTLNDNELNEARVVGQEEFQRFKKKILQSLQ